MIRLCDGMIMYRACCACVVRHAHHALASFGCAPDTGTRCDRRVIRGTSEYASQPRVGHGVYVLERCAIASCCVTKRCAIGGRVAPGWSVVGGALGPVAAERLVGGSSSVVHIDHLAHTWSLPLGTRSTRSTRSHPISLPQGAQSG